MTRLDGPTAVEAAGLVDKAISAEQTLTTSSGTGYFDAQWPQPCPYNDYHCPVNTSINNAAALSQAAGFNTVDNIQSVTGHMITSAPNTLWAWGWYGSDTGAYSFANGAVGAQLTSYTANQIRDPSGTSAWVPNWINDGITATWGASSEPYSTGYAMGDILLNHFWHGYNFAESAYLSNPYQHWMMVFIGDPLYAPKIFQNVQISTDTQAPSQVVGLSEFSTNTQVVLQWTKPFDNVGVTGYNVYRNGSFLALTQGIAYVDNQVQSGATYSYTVTAFDAAGNVSIPSAPIVVKVPGSSSTPTPTPTPTPVPTVIPTPTPTPTAVPTPTPTPTPIPTPTPTPTPTNTDPTGHLDGVKSDGTVFGWSEDPDNTSVPNQVDIYVDQNASTPGASPLVRITGRGLPFRCW